jgi:hypothetical protein
MKIKLSKLVKNNWFGGYRVFSMKSSEEIVAHFLEALIRYVAVQDRFHELNLSSLPKTTDSLPASISIEEDV